MIHFHRVILAVTCIFACAGLCAAQSDPILPDRTKTPGDVMEGVTKADVCTCRYTARVRSVPASVRRQVFSNYGITPRPGGYEVDHLISLELGGSNDIKNLWPETYHGPNNARVKDKVENKLHRLICTNVITLEEAQRAIARDWINAYNRYMDTPAPVFRCTQPRGGRRER